MLCNFTRGGFDRQSCDAEGVVRKKVLGRCVEERFTLHRSTPTRGMLNFVVRRCRHYLTTGKSAGLDSASGADALEWVVRTGTFCRRYCPETHHALNSLSLFLSTGKEPRFRRVLRCAEIFQHRGAGRLPSAFVWFTSTAALVPGLLSLSRRGWRCRRYMLIPHRHSLTWCAYFALSSGNLLKASSMRSAASRRRPPRRASSALSTRVRA